jgi:hypothetical protein
MLPQHFPWQLFLVALALMALPAGDMVRQLWRNNAQLPSAQAENLTFSDFG